MGRRFRHRDVLPGDAARGQLGRVNTLDTIAKAERVAGGPAVVEEVQTVAGGAWLARREDELADRWRHRLVLAVHAWHISIKSWAGKNALFRAKVWTKLPLLACLARACVCFCHESSRTNLAAFNINCIVFTKPAEGTWGTKLNACRALLFSKTSFPTTLANCNAFLV